MVISLIFGEARREQEVKFHPIFELEGDSGFGGFYCSREDFKNWGFVFKDGDDSLDFEGEGRLPSGNEEDDIEVRE